MKRLLVCVLLLGLLPQPARAAETPPTFVPYPFASEFDDGRLGLKLAHMLLAKARRDAQWTSFAEIIYDEIREQNPLAVTDETPVEQWAAHAGAAFDADIAVWGVIEKQGEGYNVAVKAIDRRREPGKRVFLEGEFAAENKHGLVQVAEAILATCRGAPAPQPREAPEGDDASDNLLTNGDFTDGDNGDPRGWEHPDRGVRWEVSRDGGCILFRVSPKAAATHGVMYYSDPVPVEPGAYYRLEMDIRTEDPQVIVWVKGYSDLKHPETGRVRKDVLTYKHQKRHYPEADGWQQYRTEAFRPKHPRFEIDHMRVMLYAYLRPGEVRFDNVRLVKVDAEHETESDDAMIRAFGEKDKERTEEEQGVVGGDFDE